MDFKTTLASLSNPDLAQKTAAQDALRNLTPAQADQLLTLARKQERTRARWKLFVYFCFGLYCALTLLWSFGKVVPTWPLLATVGYLGLGLVLFAFGMLLRFGALSAGYRRAVKALAYVDTKNGEVARFLIDSLGYDWPKKELPTMIQAIGRLLPKLSDTEIGFLYTEKSKCRHRRNNLWWAVRTASFSHSDPLHSFLVVKTAAEAENIARILASLMPFDQKEAHRYLKDFMSLPNDRIKTEGQQYLLAKAKIEIKDSQ